jgi:glyoxalase family protein
MPPERRSNHAVALTGFRVGSEGDLGRWEERLRGVGIAVRRTREPGYGPGVRFEDPEGQRLLLVVDDGPGQAAPWARSPVPAERHLRGLGAVTLDLPRAGPTARFLEERLGFRPLDEAADPEVPEAGLLRFRVGPGGAAGELRLRIRTGPAPARQGAGGVHHVAIRLPVRAGPTAWGARLGEAGLRTSGEVERHWFR